MRALLGGGAGPDVRRHYDHRIAEVHRAARTIRKAPLVEYLQHRIEDIGVGLFNLVEEYYRVWLPPYGFGKLSALTIADISRR